MKTHLLNTPILVAACLAATAVESLAQGLVVFGATGELTHVGSLDVSIDAVELDPEPPASIGVRNIERLSIPGDVRRERAVARDGLCGDRVCHGRQ
jgi:hypothetical protein